MSNYPTREGGLLIDPIASKRRDESYREAMDRIGADLLRRALQEHAGSTEKAASDLRMTQVELEDELDRLGFLRG